jgi:hypothetical protein
MRRGFQALCVMATILMAPVLIGADTVYDARVIDEMRKLWSFQQPWAFNSRYKGKSFSDVGTLLGYGKSQYHLGWYVEVDTADVSKHEFRNVYCVVSPSPTGNDFMKSMMARLKNFSKVRISGTMLEWNWMDDSIRLNNYCTVE